MEIQIKSNTVPGWKRTSVSVKKTEKIPGGKLKLGNVFVIRGKHTSDSKQWVFNFMGTGKDVSVGKIISLNS